MALSILEGERPLGKQMIRTGPNSKAASWSWTNSGIEERGIRLRRKGMRS